MLRILSYDINCQIIYLVESIFDNSNANTSSLLANHILDEIKLVDILYKESKNKYETLNKKKGKKYKKGNIGPLIQLGKILLKKSSEANSNIGMNNANSYMY